MLATVPLLLLPLQEYCPLSSSASERKAKVPLEYTILSDVFTTLTLLCTQNTTGDGLPTMMQSRRAGCLLGDIVFTGCTSIRGSSFVAIMKKMILVYNLTNLKARKLLL